MDHKWDPFFGESNYRSKSMAILRDFRWTRVHEGWVGVIFHVQKEGVIMALLTTTIKTTPPPEIRPAIKDLPAKPACPLIRPAIKKPEFFCGVPWGSKVPRRFFLAGLRIDANALSYTAAMSACERMGQWQRSLSLLVELEHLKASLRCWGKKIGIF